MARGDDSLDLLDAHPLVRGHFGARLRETTPTGWREAHERLYRYFAEAAPRFPETVEEMAPLYQAVVHGCEAGRYQEVFTETFTKNEWIDRMVRSPQETGLVGCGTFRDVRVLQDRDKWLPVLD